ncbi:hypothetical protein D3C85_1168560 [compost metagenome]
MDLLSHGRERVPVEIHAVLEADQSADLGETRVDHEDVTPVAAAPDRALGVGRVQFAVLCGEASLRGEPGHGVVERSALAFVDAQADPDARLLCGGSDGIRLGAGEFDRMAVKLREERGRVFGRVRPDPVRVPGQEGLGECDKPRAASPRLMNELDSSADAGLEVEEGGGSVNGCDANGFEGSRHGMKEVNGERRCGRIFRLRAHCGLSESARRHRNLLFLLMRH